MSRLLGLVAVIVIVIGVSLYLILGTPTGGVGSLSKLQIEKIVRDYIKNNPDIIVESLSDYNRKKREFSMQEAEQAIKERINELERDPHAAVVGNKDGDITIVEFFDYNCGYCKRALSTVRELLAENDNIRLVLKEFPILGPASKIASRVSIAVSHVAPDKFFDFHSKIIQGRYATQEALLQAAAELGIDTERVKEKMQDPGVDALIERNRQLAEAIGVRGTPAFVIDGKLVPGAIDKDTFLEYINRTESNS